MRPAEPEQLLLPKYLKRPKQFYWCLSGNRGGDRVKGDGGSYLPVCGAGSVESGVQPLLRRETALEHGDSWQ